MQRADIGELAGLPVELLERAARAAQARRPNQQLRFSEWLEAAIGMLPAGPPTEKSPEPPEQVEGPEPADPPEAPWPQNRMPKSRPGPRPAGLPEPKTKPKPLNPPVRSRRRDRYAPEDARTAERNRIERGIAGRANPPGGSGW
jgi:hypothetical protein